MRNDAEFLAISKNLQIKNYDNDTTIKEKLDRLALDLATNYCTASFGEAEKRKVKLSDIFDTNNPLYTQLKLQLKGVKRSADADVSNIVQHRNILIIGAGATYDSYKCIPLGNQVIERFEAKYKGKIDAFPAIKVKFENHLNELRLQNREPDFENMLSIYAELILTPNELRSEISELFNFRYCPSLFYELVAHLFKHSFIDVIINFNFDEILDQAIEQEVGGDNYYRIISDGDCVPIEELMVDGRLKIPIYIKPHGTVSHRSTLRFTKRHYLDMPDQIKEILIKLISGHRGEVIGKKNEEIGHIKKVNIISAGFNLESLEFGDILNECLPEQSQIYHICYEEIDKRRDPFFVNKILPAFYQRAYDFYINEESKPWNERELHNHIYTRIAVEKFNTVEDTREKSSLDEETNKITTPFAELFSYLWRTIYYQFKEDLTPRSIARHEIVSYFFYNQSFSKYNNKAEAEINRKLLISSYESSTEYFLDRTIVEIAMAINRNNGIIEIAQLLSDRAGLFYKKYRDYYFIVKKTNKGAYSIYDLINQFGSIERERNNNTTYSKNIFQLNVDTLNKLKIDEALQQLQDKGNLNVAKIVNSMKRWEIKNLNTTEFGTPQIDREKSPLIQILVNFNKILHKENPPYDPVAVTILFRGSLLTGF